MIHRSFFVSTLVAFAALASPAGASAIELSEVTAAEFYGAAYFQQALEHPKISKLRSRSDQINAIARDLKWSPKKLKAAIDKLDALGGDLAGIGKLAEAAIRRAAERSRVKGQLRDVLINSEEPKHVVVYVRWQGTTQREVVKEAATIASIVAEETPLVSTLSLSAIHPKAAKSSKDSVWSGKISADSMAKIHKQRIDDYGDRLYRGLFEGVEEKTF